LRTALIYSAQSKKLELIARRILSLIQKTGHSVEEIKVEETTKTPSFYGYELIFVGSPVLGFWGGKYPETLANYLRRASGLEGKKSVVFVTPKTFGVNKATKKIMHQLEKKGSFVIDFRCIKSVTEAEEFGQKLLSRFSRKES